MSRTQRSITAILLLGCLSALGCGKSAESDSLIHVNVWSMWNGAEEEHFQAVLDRYHQLHPNIIIHNLGSVQDDTKTARAIVAGAPPDLATVANPLYLGPLAANGALLELDELFKRSGLKEDTFVPASLALCRYRGKQYAMPFLTDDYALLYNRKAFKEAGLDPDKPPKTLEEFEDIAKKLTRRGPDGKLTQLGFMPMDDPYMFFMLAGGSLYDPVANAVTPDHPGCVEGLDRYAKLLNSMGTFEEVNSFKAGFGAQQGANNPFFTGKVAMMIQGEWNPWWCFKFAPELDYAVAAIPAPAAHPERANTTWIGGNLFVIPRGAKHAKEAWDLLVWMQTDEAQLLLAAANNNLPNQRSTLKLPQLRTGEKYRVNSVTFLDSVVSPNGRFFPVIPVANLYNDQLINAKDQVQSGERTALQALKDVKERVQKQQDLYH